MRLIAFSSALLLVIACSSTTPSAPTNDEFALAVGASVMIENSDVRLRFLRVATDSRCPSDVECIWAGNGQIELEVRAGGDTDTLILNTFDGATEGVAGDYRIRLVALNPIPKSSEPIDPSEYRATLQVSRVGLVCTEEARPALMVTVTDSLVPNFFTFTNVSVVAVDGAYRDSAFVALYHDQPFYTAIPLAYERGGTYTVTVRADGYAPWIRSGIEVQEDACHVVTVPIQARLRE